MFNFIWRILRRRLAEAFQPLYCILFSRRTDNWLITRYILRYLSGVCTASLLGSIVLLNVCSSTETQFTLLSVMTVLGGVGYVVSPCVKCVTLLILVGMATSSGRNYLRALSFAYIITGPIANLATNGGEVVRVFACATTLTYNLTKTRFDLMTKPFRHTLSTVKDDIRDVQSMFRNLSSVLEPIHQEVEGDKLECAATRTNREALITAEAVQTEYKKKFENRCRWQLAKSEERCRETFSTAFDNCRDKLPVIVRTLLCWPFQAHFVCKMNILGSADKLCNPSDALPDNFGETYAELEMMENELYKNNSKVEVSYKIEGSIANATKRKSRQTAQMVMEEFSTRKRFFDAVMGTLKTCLSLLLMRVVTSAISYHRQYKRNIEFDNVYITDYFRHIDNRRKTFNKRSLLPLTKFERKLLVDLQRACHHTRDECRAIMFHSVQFSLEILTGCFFLLLDYLIVTLLDIVRSKSLISYAQEGEHVIHFHVNGTGLMARLLRKTLYKFNMHERVSTYLTNEACLPQPAVLSTRFYTQLLFLYGLIFVLICKSSLVVRMRRLICAYFHRDREKKRVRYLYGNLLKRRQAMSELMAEKAETNGVKHKVRRELNILLRLRLYWPEYFDWLKVFNAARFKCLICDELEDGHFNICPNTECGLAYCCDCWNDVGCLCIACKTPIKPLELCHKNSKPTKSVRTKFNI